MEGRRNPQKKAEVLKRTTSAPNGWKKYRDYLTWLATDEEEWVSDLAGMTSRLPTPKHSEKTF